MRLFRSKTKSRKFELPAPRAAADTAPVSLEAKAASNYKNLQQAALTRERRVVIIL